MGGGGGETDNSTHNVEDGEDEEQVVEDAVHALSRERPDGDSVAEDADDADDEDEQPLGRPLEPRHAVSHRTGAVIIGRSRISRRSILGGGGGVERETGVVIGHDPPFEISFGQVFNGDSNHSSQLE